jgi:type II secretory pathway pseudopilin PulG
MKKQRGVSIVELLIVAVIGTLIVMAAYEVLVTNRRVFTVQNAKVQAQQSTRSAMEVLFGELREVSSEGSDILAFGPDSLAARSMREFGAVCDALPLTHATTPQLLVRKIIADFESGDSVFVFADNDEFLTTDDEWFRAKVTAIDTTATCADGGEAQLMTFAGQTTAFSADTVRTGAPIRSFTRLSYRLGEFESQKYLGRAEGDGRWVPLVGPLAGVSGRPGLEFGFLDGAGNTVATADQIQQMTVKIRSFSQARGTNGAFVVDSLSSRIYMRN